MTDEGAKAIARSIDLLAGSFFPRDAAPGQDAAGGHVASVTEALMGVTGALQNIADAIDRVADLLDERLPP